MESTRIRKHKADMTYFSTRELSSTLLLSNTLSTVFNTYRSQLVNIKYEVSLNVFK